MQTIPNPASNQQTKVKSGLFYLGVALIAGFFIGLCVLILWATYHFMPALWRLNDRFVSLVEGLGTLAVLATVIATLAMPTAIALSIAFFLSDAFKESLTRPYYWLKITVFVLFGIQIIQLLTYFGLGRFEKQYLSTHSFYYNLLLHSIFCVWLLLLGIVIYLFKRTSKILYGMSEIVVSLLPNIIVIQQLDLTHLPNFNIDPKGPLLLFGGLIYVLSRGISNVAEGVQDWITATHGPPPTVPPPAAASANPAPLPADATKPQA